MKWPNKRPANEQAEPPALSAGMQGVDDGEWATEGHDRMEFLPSSWVHDWLFGFLLVAVTLIDYQPAWHGGFIWDDNRYVTKNALLTAPDGLRRIWFSLDSPSQYFPLTYTTFYLEHALWGFNPAGYHLVNLLLHAANVLLVWQLLARLRVPGAWLAAAVFALHPVQVESVAWVTERKNVLMGFFFLLTLWAWIKFIEGQSKRPWRFYVLALVFYALALFAKTTACTLPAALLLILWLRKMPIHWRRLGQVAPFVAMGIGMGLVTVWWERHHQGTQGKLFAIGPVERVLIASRALWFYAGKLLWPSNLTFSYPRWTISASEPLAYGWLLATAALGVVIWRARRWAGRSIEVAAVYFAATLSPVLGFIMLYTFVYSFVADHYQYLACIGPIALAAAGMQIGLGRIAAGKPFLWPVLCAALLMTLGVLTWKQCGMYANAETLWQATIRLNPDSWMSHYNLGNTFVEQGLVDRAITQYKEALQIKPDYAEGHNNLGNALYMKARMDEAITQYQAALQIQPDYAQAHNNLGNALLQRGKVSEATAHFKKALQFDPANPSMQNNLAWLLATCPEASLRDGAKAVELARQANALTGGKSAIVLHTLAAAYAEAGRFPEAVQTAQRALQLTGAQSNAKLAGQLQYEMKLYHAGSPLHSPEQTR